MMVSKVGGFGFERATVSPTKAKSNISPVLGSGSSLGCNESNAIFDIHKSFRNLKAPS